MSAFLEMHDVTKVFGQGPNSTTALADFSLRIDEHSPTITAIAGESGSGKSTLARLLLGFEKPTSGTVAWRGKNLSTLSGGERLEFRREVRVF